MVCDKCGKDKPWTEMQPISRKDTTPNFYLILKPTPPKKQQICWDCLGWKRKVV